MPETVRGADFSATDLKHEMRPPELWTPETGFRDDWSVDDRDDFVELRDEEEGLLPHPVLDPMHGPIRPITEDWVQVLTVEDVYHELVEWLDEVFDIPRGYDVYWVDLEPTGQNVAIEPHALIHLRDDQEVHVNWPTAVDSLPVAHHYKRGDHRGHEANGRINDGGIEVLSGSAYEESRSPSSAAARADEVVRGDAAPDSGQNGWDWWSVGDDEFPLDALRQ